MNLSEIRTRVQRQFGDTSGAQITTDDIDRWANDAQNDICRRIDILQATETISSVAGTDTYDLPVGIIRVRRATYGGRFLTRTTLEEMDKYLADRDWVATAGTPERYYVLSESIVLWPVPDTSTVDTVKVWYSRRAAALVAPADVPEIPLHMHEEIVRYALARAYELDENFDGSKAAMVDYDTRISEARDEANWPYQDSYPSVRTLPGDD